jgi:chemotaxis signal transduction protein
LRKILELRERTAKTEIQVVVIQTSEASAGIAVDEIAGISSIPELELQSPKQLMRPSIVGLFKGIRNDRLAVLDIVTLFADSRLIVESNP